MSLKLKAMLGLVIIALAFFAGQHSISPIVETKVVEHIVTVEKKDEHAVIVKHEVKKANGDTIIDTTTTDDSHAETASTADKATETKVIETRMWQIGALRSVTNSDYSLLVERKLFTNVSVISTITTVGNASVGIAVSF
jgi:hypothetical protein